MKKAKIAQKKLFHSRKNMWRRQVHYVIFPFWW